MSVASHIFSRFESAPKNRMDSDGVKVVRRYNAPNGALGAIAEAESGAHNLAHKKCIKQRATSLQVQEIRPGDGSTRLAASGSAEGQQLLLVRYGRVRTE